MRNSTEYGFAQTLYFPVRNVLPMNTPNETTNNLFIQPARRLLQRNLKSLASDLLPLGDFLSVFFAAYLSLVIVNYWQGDSGQAFGFSSDFWNAVLVVAVLVPFILYDRNFAAVASRGQMLSLVHSAVLRLLLSAGVIFLLANLSYALTKFPGSILLSWLLLSVLLMSLTRVLVAHTVLRLRRQGKLTEVIAVVGVGPVADRLIHALRQTRSDTVELLGVFDDKIVGAAPSANPSAGTLAQLIELGKTRPIDWILLALPATAELRVLSVMQRLKTLSVPIGLCPQQVDMAVPYRSINYVAGSVPVSVLADRPIRHWDAVLKGIEDYVIGSMAVLLLLPLLIVVAVAIKIDSPGPVIFKQRRHAFNNHEFNIYKFRTMRWDISAAANALVQTSRQDDRFTRLGRFLRAWSLDELPQLFNVLKGDMSLVGPRPHAVNMRTENQLGHEITEIYAHRHRVKPGITGWSQVNGSRGAIDTTAQLRRRVELDLYYIENWSVLLDLKILLMTSLVVFKRTNAF